MTLASTRTNADIVFGDGMSLDEAELLFRREFVIAALKRLEGNQTAAAAAIGVPRNRMVRYLSDLGIDSRVYRQRRPPSTDRVIAHLTVVDEAAICAYLDAHPVPGAKMRMARRYRVSPSAITRVLARRAARQRAASAGALPVLQMLGAVLLGLFAAQQGVGRAQVDLVGPVAAQLAAQRAVDDDGLRGPRVAGGHAAAAALAVHHEDIAFGPVGGHGVVHAHGQQSTPSVRLEDVERRLA